MTDVKTPPEPRKRDGGGSGPNRAAPSAVDREEGSGAARSAMAGDREDPRSE